MLFRSLLKWKAANKEAGEKDFHYFQQVIVEGMKNTVGLNKHKEAARKQIFKAFIEHFQYPLTSICM